MTTTSQSDDQRAEQRGLIAAAEAGDERAFRRLVEPHTRAIEVHCYRMLGSLQDAEDIAQETLMRAWRTLDRFEQRSSLQTWLYRIATNACLDELERRPRRPQPVDPYPDSRLEDAEEPLADPAARYAMREGIELAFLTAIQRLPGRQRAILILRDVLGWTAPEVAELLESTVAGVNSALQRARATIDAELPATTAKAAGPKQRELLDSYLSVWENGDIDGLVALLREDAVIHMPPEPSVAGAREIGEFFATVPLGGDIHRITLVPTSANGLLGFVMHFPGDDGGTKPHGVMLLHTDDERVASIDVWRDEALPAKFED
jgi:RNA polymerase sigma-70 factor (ECF subfamily)